MTIAEFLLARIAEDEEFGRKSAMGDTRVREQFVEIYRRKRLGPYPVFRLKPDRGARVLAECEAKRQIVEMGAAARSVAESNDATLGDAFVWRFAEGVLSQLAAVYADHPDFRQEWRP